MQDTSVFDISWFAALVKNCLTSMARAVFQVVQDHTPTSEISSTKIKRGQDRSLSMTEETTSLMAC
jgi:hypothetical protein